MAVNIRCLGPALGGEKLHRSRQAGIAGLRRATLQRTENGGSTSENTGIKTIEVRQALADIVDLPVFRHDSGDIAHVDEAAGNIPIHSKRNCTIGERKRHQLTGNRWFKKMVRHQE